MNHCEGSLGQMPKEWGQAVQGGSGREVSCGRWNLIHPPKDGQDLNKYKQEGGYSLSRQWHVLK